MIVVAVLWIGPGGRPFAKDLLIIGIVAGWESLHLSRFGATLGMRAVDLHVATLDRTGPVPWLQAFRRSLPVALCYALPFPGTITVILMPIVLLTSLAMSPYRQAFHERISDTITVVVGAPDLITRQSMETWYDPSGLEVMTPWGRAPDLHERRRARAHRLDDVWWLAVIIVVGTIATVVFTTSRLMLVWLMLGWIVVFCADEAWRVASTGATPGHARSGFRIVDITTGANPSMGRSILRAVVLAPFLYVPPLQLVLGLWVRASSTHRGPHDLAARTVVVDPDWVQPVLPYVPHVQYVPYGLYAPFASYGPYVPTWSSPMPHPPPGRPAMDRPLPPPPPPPLHPSQPRPQQGPF